MWPMFDHHSIFLASLFWTLFDLEFRSGTMLKTENETSWESWVQNRRFWNSIAPIRNQEIANLYFEQHAKVKRWRCIGESIWNIIPTSPAVLKPCETCENSPRKPLLMKRLMVSITFPAFYRMPIGYRVRF